jgi:hypothetical protein
MNDHLLRERQNSAYVPANVFSAWYEPTSYIRWSISTWLPTRPEIRCYDPSGVQVTKTVTGEVKVPSGTKTIPIPGRWNIYCYKLCKSTIIKGTNIYVRCCPALLAG